MTRTSSPKDKRIAKLEALASVLEQHGMSIGGCGCCGSPWISFKDATVEDIDTARISPDGLREHIEDMDR